MPGPGGPGGGRPGRPGGGPGGPGGGMPMGGNGPSIYINGRAYNRFAPAATGRSLTPTSGPVESVAVYVSNVKSSFSHAIDVRGPVKGTLTGIRHSLTNGLHVASFERKVQSAAEAFRKGKITEEQFAIRRMQAAGDYYKYLGKLGLYNDAQITSLLRRYAEQNEIVFEDDTPTDSMSR